MIYTCTLNTAIDLYVAVDELKPDRVNRTHDEDYQPNGKGVNVSIMLKRHGIDSIALGFIAGFSGQYIEDSLKELGIQTNFVQVDGITRINVFINSTKEYKIVNQGPMIQTHEQEQLLTKIKAISAGNTLVVSGSLPKGVPQSIIIDIAKICAARDIKLVLDTSVSTVIDTLDYKPFLLKPNEEELADLFHKKHPLSEAELVECGTELLKKGAQHVLVSRGKEGALYLSRNNILKVTSPQGQVVNTACSGDAMLATFISKQIQNYTVEEALSQAVATGASTAFSKGLSDLKDISTLIKDVTITPYKEASL
ncbi:1-phosphofructokinase [Priestia filamentosa]|uniref:1-phosphofructokinase n=1 Tax=Priestia filamentosa TaxID=1402861 RepID=UPI000E757D50|nr:1-phosphofructokinase [Priestia filamentosa]RJS62732.1 1-phosphofructokinase [Priestia filamentosa]